MKKIVSLVAVLLVTLFIAVPSYAGLTFVFDVDKQEGFVVKQDYPDNHLWIIIPSMNLSFWGRANDKNTMDLFRKEMKLLEDKHIQYVIEPREDEHWEHWRR